MPINLNLYFKVKPIKFPDSDRCLIVAALHFEPMFTKCVWALRNVFESNPSQFYMYDKPLSYQTCALLLDKNKELICFGEDAETEYKCICLDGNEDDFYLFSQFTTKFNNRKVCSSSLILNIFIVPHKFKCKRITVNKCIRSYLLLLA